MDGKDKTKGSNLESLQCTCMAHWKVILGIVVVLIIILNTFWNMMESKIAETIAKEVEPLKAELKTAKSDLTAVDSVKEDIAAIKQASQEFEVKLNAVIKAEEDKLAGMEKETQIQKEYLGSLKNMLESTQK